MAMASRTCRKQREEVHTVISDGVAKSDREGLGGVVGAMLREREAESKAEKKAKDAESRPDKKAKEADKKAKAKGKSKGKGKGKEQSKGQKCKGSVKGKGTGESSRADTARVRKPCVHYEATRFQFLGRSGRDGKGGSKKFRFAGVNANYPDKEAAKLASDAWLAEEMNHWPA